MRFFGGGGNSGSGVRPLTYEDIVRAVRAEVDPLRTSIAALQVDTRADMIRLEAKMDAGFVAMDNRYVTQAVAREHDSVIEIRLKTVEGRITEIEKKTDSAGMNNLTRVGIAAGVFFGFMALIISILVNVLPHYAYHP